MEGYTFSVWMFFIVMVIAFLAALLTEEEDLAMRVRAEIFKASTINIPEETLRSIWLKYVESGKDPIKVIALARLLCSLENKASYEQELIMSSAYKSQVKHLWRSGKVFLAFQFRLKAREHAKVAQKEEVEYVLTASELSALADKQCRLAKKLYCFPLARFHRRKATELLRKSLARSTEPGSADECLVRARLYELTKETGMLINTRRLIEARGSEWGIEIKREIARCLGMKVSEFTFD